MNISSQLNLKTAKNYLQTYLDGGLNETPKQESVDLDIEDTMKNIAEADEYRYKLVLADRNLVGVPDGNPEPGVVEIEFDGSRFAGEYNGNNSTGDFALEEDGQFLAVQQTEEQVHMVALADSDEGLVLQTVTLNRYGTGHADAYLIAGLPKADGLQ